MATWEVTAKAIAREAWGECKDDEEAAIEFIEESVDGCEDVIYYTSAYETVCDARLNDYDTFEAANLDLVDTGCDEIRKDETIDNVIVRLAYLIIRQKALEYYYSILKEKTEQEEDEVEEAH